MLRIPTLENYCAGKILHAARSKSANALHSWEMLDLCVAVE